ncbi:hypothetical protein AHMF7605_08440 [Adhaeribacter arboris]|uniref:Uncharacterized protein n=1 Tax=Adhaeribacter arboris TaxID=2072846 RepID=A0A2T2YDG8_9BACT|nr:hypothetical protein [Adhaeribacter arboris]PSR53551.1 hypothetical protein AHMF7605_08440 [Adhaeribacter arboris]
MTIHNLKPNEREVIKLANHFGKRAEKLIKLGKLSPEHQQVSESCTKLTEQIYAHAAAREVVLERREKLGKIVQDHATCPQCHKNSHLKITGIARHEKGWQSNKYKCRRCNVQFTWNRPNNPWDMLLFMQDYVAKLNANIDNEALDPEVRQHSEIVVEQIKQNILQLEPVLNQSDEEFTQMNQRDEEMTRLLQSFKSYLQIEKIKMDSWQID